MYIANNVYALKFGTFSWFLSRHFRRFGARSKGHHNVAATLHGSLAQVACMHTRLTVNSIVRDFLLGG